MKAAIGTSNSSFFASSGLVRWLGLGTKRRFDETEFVRDVYRLILLYRQSGYMDVTVDTAVTRTDEDIRIVFQINEGVPSLVDSITLDGAESSFEPRELLQRLPIRVGDPFDRLRFQAAADTIKAAFQNRGYPWADVFTSYSMDEQARRVNVAFEVLPGPKAHVGEVTIDGVERLSANVVMRALPFRPGDEFRLEALYQSQRDLYRMQTFRFVNVALLDSLQPEEWEDTVSVPVRVGVFVNEGPLRRIHFGIGYGSLDCLRTQAGWGARNFLGGGRTFEVNAGLSKIGIADPVDLGLEQSFACSQLDDSATSKLNWDISTTLRQPGFLSRQNTAALSLFWERRSEVKAFVREAGGGNVSLTREFVPRLPLTLFYELASSKTTANDAVFCSQFDVCQAEEIELLGKRRQTGVVGITLRHETTDNVLNPRRGVAQSFEFLHSSGLVGSDSLSRFNKGLVDVAFYHPVGRTSVFAWRLRGGLIFPTSQVTIEGGEARFVPPDQRFYAGGPNTVRGFSRNSLGPVVYVGDAMGIDPDSLDLDSLDVEIAAVGGQAVFVANAEYRFPGFIYPERFRLALFVDIGQVWSEVDDIRPRELRITPGIGARLATPLGPARLDVAWNPYQRQAGPLYLRVGDQLQRREDEFVLQRGTGFFNRLTLHFSVGHAF